jgi:hypothetical protein
MEYEPAGMHYDALLRRPRYAPQARLWHAQYAASCFRGQAHTSNALLLNSHNFLTVSITVHPIFKKPKWFMHADFKALFDFLPPSNTFHAVS